MFNLLNTPIVGVLGKVALKFGIKAKLPIKGIIKATLFDQFVGGENLKKSLPIVEKLYASRVYSILDYSVEAKETEAEKIHALNELLENIKFSSGESQIPFCVFKTTAFSSSAILEKVSSSAVLSESEQKEWNQVTERFELLCKTAASLHQPIMVDAEETWIQKAIDDLANKMMDKFNRNSEIIVLNTFQLYRKDRLAYLKECYQNAKAQGYKLGVKLVRGAYMEKERAHAIALGKESPIQNTKEEADKDYNEALGFCLDKIEEISIVVGTHNEFSALFAATYLVEKGLPLSHRHVWFSQLYGMCDFISFNLANAGYNVAKYLPYGPVESVTPYLIRRADENSSVAGQSRKELSLLRKEINRRENEKN